MKAILYFLLTCSILLPIVAAAQDKISIAGKWSFRLDSADVGLIGHWYNERFSQSIDLPGTTDEAGYGTKTAIPNTGYLTRKYKYYGPAWYQRDIIIPHEWKGRRIFLEMERVMWESTVFINGTKISTQDALNSSHLVDLGYLTPGEHRLTIRINNDMIHNIGDNNHAYTDYTQTIWNGIVGRIQLLARDKVRFSNPMIFTKIDPWSITFRDTILNDLPRTVDVSVVYELHDRESGDLFHKGYVNRKLKTGQNELDVTASAPGSVKLWDDISPNLYVLTISIIHRGKLIDSRQVEVGFREVTASRSRFIVNGRPVFLRGNIDNVHFPITGYPSCRIEDWERIFRIYKSYGLNRVRFHSWCPPEAAFLAANRIGLYIQAEVAWIDGWWLAKGNPAGLGKNPSADPFVKRELSNMARAYGNNPSFTAMSIGNELGASDFDVIAEWLDQYKRTDPRRLYSVSTARKITPVDQFIVTHHIEGLGDTRGQKGGASTEWDFENIYSRSDIPVIAHEIGQWPVYPDWKEITKYTGVLQAKNLEVLRSIAEEHKTLEQADDFRKVSGALNQLMYKDEIESFLRTPSCAGFDLLSMQDYQGQGEALVGWLDVFFDSKNIITPERFRNYCDTTVPLLRVVKRVWKSSEAFTARIQLAHYGRADITDVVYWKIKDDQSNVIGGGTLDRRTFQMGSSEIIGGITCSLQDIKRAKKLTVEIGLKDRPIFNQWNIWAYPEPETANAGSVFIADRFDEHCIRQLEAGKKVLLKASRLGREPDFNRISFYPLYWSMADFPGQERENNTIGMIVQHDHPAFKKFPTDVHSDWQWERIYKNARAFNLKGYPEDFKPIAQPVHDFHRSNKLGAVFELKVGKGKLLVCGFELPGKEEQGNIVADQLMSSILAYMNSDDFNPEFDRDISSLRSLFAKQDISSEEASSAFENMLLYVESGVRKVSDGWSILSDRYQLKDGVYYRVECDRVVKDAKQTGWLGKEIAIDINCPKGIPGSLTIFFSGAEGRLPPGELSFEGRNYSLSERKPDGSLKLNVMREDTKDGILRIRIKTSDQSDVVISKLELLKE